MKNYKTLFLCVLLLILPGADLFSQAPQGSVPDEETDHLVVLWTSDDPYLAERMVFMYTHTAKTAGWFNEVTLIIWGPSAKLLSENSVLQDKVGKMMEDGISVQACVVCANLYDVTDKFKELGFEVKGMGKPLTAYLKSGAKVLTF